MRGGDKPAQDSLILGRVGNPHAQAIAHRCRGLLLAAGGDLPGAIDAMAGALVAHGQRPLPPEIGRTLVEKGALERRAKQKSAAKQTLEAALELLTLPGARLWAARAQDELSRIGLRRAVPSQGLTPAQTRVAEMVVGGMSNREIAGSLYMSERTVEAHLTRIYREFGVRSRTQLVMVWPAAGLSSDQVMGDRAPGDSPSATPASQAYENRAAGRAFQRPPSQVSAVPLRVMRGRRSSAGRNTRSASAEALVLAAAAAVPSWR